MSAPALRQPESAWLGGSGFLVGKSVFSTAVRVLAVPPAVQRESEGVTRVSHRSVRLVASTRTPLCLFRLCIRVRAGDSRSSRAAWGGEGAGQR